MWGGRVADDDIANESQYAVSLLDYFSYAEAESGSLEIGRALLVTEFNSVYTDGMSERGMQSWVSEAHVCLPWMSNPD